MKSTKLRTTTFLTHNTLTSDVRPSTNQKQAQVDTAHVGDDHRTYALVYVIQNVCVCVCVYSQLALVSFDSLGGAEALAS